ncbi:hypothetical protein BH10PSE6_BH10PSE6_49860 [soil metagenome]
MGVSLAATRGSGPPVWRADATIARVSTCSHILHVMRSARGRKLRTRTTKERGRLFCFMSSGSRGHRTAMAVPMAGLPAAQGVGGLATEFEFSTSPACHRARGPLIWCAMTDRRSALPWYGSRTCSTYRRRAPSLSNALAAFANSRESLCLTSLSRERRRRFQRLRLTTNYRYSRWNGPRDRWLMPTFHQPTRCLRYRSWSFRRSWPSSQGYWHFGPMPQSSPRRGSRRRPT